MSERDALLAAIREGPHDDLPRLALADWLDEDGQANRAELIRVQCELDRSRGLVSAQRFDLHKIALGAKACRAFAEPKQFARLRQLGLRQGRTKGRSCRYGDGSARRWNFSPERDAQFQSMRARAGPARGQRGPVRGRPAQRRKRIGSPEVITRLRITIFRFRTPWTPPPTGNDQALDTV